MGSLGEATLAYLNECADGIGAACYAGDCECAHHSQPALGVHHNPRHLDPSYGHDCTGSKCAMNLHQCRQFVPVNGGVVQVQIRQNAKQSIYSSASGTSHNTHSSTWCSCPRASCFQFWQAAACSAVVACTSAATPLALAPRQWRPSGRPWYGPKTCTSSTQTTRPTTQEAQQIYCKEREASTKPVVLDPFSHQTPPGFQLYPQNS